MSPRRIQKRKTRQEDVVMPHKAEKNLFERVNDGDNLCTTMLKVDIHSPFSMYVSKRIGVPDNDERKEIYGMTNKYCDSVFLRDRVTRVKNKHAVILGRTNKDVDFFRPIVIEKIEVDKSGNPVSKEKLTFAVYDSFTTRHLVMDNWILGKRIFRQNPIILSVTSFPSINPDDQLLVDLIDMKSTAIMSHLDKYVARNAAKIDPSITKHFDAVKSAMNDMLVISELECNGNALLDSKFTCTGETSNKPCNVTRLNMAKCDLGGIPFVINKLVKLQDLDLSRNSIKVIDGIDALVDLETLKLNDNEIESIVDLDKLVNLHSLDLGSNAIDRIDNLYTLKKLEMLFLNNNAINRITGLDNTSELKQLDLHGNSIENIDGIDHLSKLEKLDLGSNKITSITSIEKNLNLKELGLKNNIISTFKDVTIPASVEKMDVAGNPISKNKITLFKKAHPGIAVTP